MAVSEAVAAAAAVVAVVVAMVAMTRAAFDVLPSRVVLPPTIRATSPLVLNRALPFRLLFPASDSSSRFRWVDDEHDNMKNMTGFSPVLICSWADCFRPLPA